MNNLISQAVRTALNNLQGDPKLVSTDPAQYIAETIERYLRDAGLAVVPGKPTEAMKKRGAKALDISWGYQDPAEATAETEATAAHVFRAMVDGADRVSNNYAKWAEKQRAVVEAARGLMISGGELKDRKALGQALRELNE